MGSSGSKETAPPDTVLLHGGYSRCPNIVHPSPFVFKVELFMRINKIPYKFTEKGGFSAKGKVPWIEYNGETVADSQFIIKYLNKKFDIDLDKNLSDVEKATATAYRIMAEEFLYFIANLEIIVYNDIAHIKTMVNYPTPMLWVYKNRESGKMKTQGIGNHSVEEVRQKADEQLGALSTFLGDKPYMMGDEPTELDCSIVGVLSTFKWALKADNPVRKMVEDKYTNLNEYMERIKTEYYPDWEQLLTPVVTDKNKNTKGKTSVTENGQPSEKTTENGETTEKPLENGETTKTATENGEPTTVATTENGKPEVVAT